ncbi:MAG TPA: DUF4388 domain-containing protein [Acidimicrobiales bacterium]|nr:DUF4388 domain-containing protein [Acidimicrobiales bacterium]
MPLAGTFDVLDFGDVLSLLSRRSATGRLQLRTANMHGVIWLADGQATAAEIGTSSGGESRNRWRSQLDDICFDALRSQRGSFEFHPEDEVTVPAGPRVKLETLLANGRRRIEIWQDVESVIHSFEAVPRLAEALNDDSLTVSQDRWKVLVAIDGRRTVAALAKRMDIELLEFCQLLKPLIESGAVLLDQPEGWLKSLPKVKLDISGPTPDIDPALVIDAGGPEDRMALLNVNSTVVPSNPKANGGNGTARAVSAPAGSSPAGSSGTGQAGSSPAGGSGDSGTERAASSSGGSSPAGASGTAHAGSSPAGGSGGSAEAADPAAATPAEATPAEAQPESGVESRPRRRLRGRSRTRPAGTESHG